MFKDEPTPEDAPPELRRIVEALLFLGGEPLTAERVVTLMRGIDTETYLQAIDSLNHDYRKQARPYQIEAKGDGYVLTIKPAYRHVVEKVYGGPREARLSTAAVDVLALVAYRQPVTKAQIDSLRGAESGALLKQLTRRGLVQVSLGEREKGQEASFATTPRFLELFGLADLDDLPRTQDLQQM